MYGYTSYIIIHVYEYLYVFMYVYTYFYIFMHKKFFTEKPVHTLKIFILYI